MLNGRIGSWWWYYAFRPVQQAARRLAGALRRRCWVCGSRVPGHKMDCYGGQR